MQQPPGYPPGSAPQPGYPQQQQQQQPMQGGPQQQQQPGFGGMPAGGPQPMQAQRQPQQDKGFVASLFDFSFNYFITAKVMKVIYGFLLVGVVLVFLGFEAMVIDRLGSSYCSSSCETEGYMMMLGAPFLVPFGMIGARIYCELLIVFVRMAEYLREIASKS